MADQPEHGRMSDTPSSVFVRQELMPERPAPVKTTGFIGFLRTRLFNSPSNILVTIVCALLLWFLLVPTIKFTLIDAVWTGNDRTAGLDARDHLLGERDRIEHTHGMTDHIIR